MKKELTQRQKKVSKFLRLVAFKSILKPILDYLGTYDSFIKALIIILILYYQELAQDILYYFGPDSMVPEKNPFYASILFLHWSIPTIAYTLVLLFICLTLLWYYIYPKVQLTIIAIIHISFMHANPLIIHEPQQILSLFIISALFFPLDDYTRNTKKPSYAKTFLVALLGTYYFFAGAKKLLDPLWLNGEALQYILTYPGFIQQVFPIITQNNTLLTFATYATILFELTFIFAIYQKSRLIKITYILLGIVFHISIALFLDVGNFTLVMFCWYILLIGNIK
jgi:hypothetical protein